jgi:hypothetical protein
VAGAFVLLIWAFPASETSRAADPMVSATVPVKIVRFDSLGDHYTLVVYPARTNPPDPFMGTCERFEVRGVFGSLRGSNGNTEPGVSKSAHRDAIQFLNEAFTAGRMVDLGWVGRGFVPVDEGKPCVVKSRALVVVKDGLGTHVLSYHDAAG